MKRVEGAKCSYCTDGHIASFDGTDSHVEVCTYCGGTGYVGNRSSNWNGRRTVPFDSQLQRELVNKNDIFFNTINLVRQKYPKLNK